MLKYITALLVAVRAVSGQLITDSITGTTTVSGLLSTSSPSPSTSVAYSCVTTVSAIGPFVTIYNLVFEDVCSTGITYNTYTITDTCGCTHSTDYTRPTGCPTGFTVTSKVCTACAGAPTITVTLPINSAAQASQTYQPTAYANSNSNSNSTPVYTPGVPGIPGTPSAARASSSGTSGAKPSVVTTGAATASSSNSILGSILVLTMTLVAGLMWVL